MVGVPMLKAERISCSGPKLSDAQTRNFEAIKHRRKVGYGPRRKSAPAGAGRRSAFEALPGDAFGVEMLEPAELDLTPGCVERAGAPIGARRRWRSNPAGTTESSPRHPSR